ASVRQCADQLGRRLSPRVGDGNFDVDVLTPSRDLVCLLSHGSEIIRKDLEGNGAIRYGMQDIAGKSLIIEDVGLPHERRIRGKTLDQRVVVHLQHPGFISAVSKEFYVEVGEGFQAVSPLRRMMRAAVSRSGATQSG